MVFCHTVVNAICSVGCPYGWRQFGQSCYMMVTDTPLNWYEARQVCLDAGSDLALPNSKAENDFIWNMQQEVIQSQERPLALWLGCTYGMEASGQWKWYGGDQTEYINKLKTGTVLQGTGCFMIRYGSGDWDFLDCATEEKRVMCEQPQREMCTRMNRCISTPLRCFAVTTMDSEHHDQPYCLLGHTFKEAIIKSPIQCCLACSPRIPTVAPSTCLGRRANSTMPPSPRLMLTST